MNPSHILITGASSGIGAALARGTARPGRRLVLGGRDEARLSEVGAACRAAGADVATAAVDVADRAAMEAWIAATDMEIPLDLVVANAGISAGTGGGGESAEQARRIMAINVDGVLNTVLPAAAAMRRRGRGQLAVMSSLGAFSGFPGAPAYCASKATVRVWGEALRAELAADGVGVSVICPGFVKTPMTDVNRFRMPFRIDADRAAAIILRGLERNRGRIAFPLPMYATVRLIAALPDGVRNRLLGGLPRKE